MISLTHASKLLLATVAVAVTSTIAIAAENTPAIVCKNMRSAEVVGLNVNLQNWSITQSKPSETSWQAVKTIQILRAFPDVTAPETLVTANNGGLKTIPPQASWSEPPAPIAYWDGAGSDYECFYGSTWTMARWKWQH
jgi:hypothetical protein